jgi:hypothetical protein
MLKIDDVYNSESRNFALGEYVSTATRPVSQSFAASRRPQMNGARSVQRYHHAPMTSTFYSNNQKSRGFRNTLMTQSYDVKSSYSSAVNTMHKNENIQGTTQSSGF